MNAIAGQLIGEPAADSATAPAVSAQWSRTDNAVLVALLAIAAITRLWHLGHPRAAVFDEIFFVGRGGAYLRGETFAEPHPPLAQELIALSMWFFGTSNPWAWRLPNATAGIALVGITYALARRMFESRPAGALAAAFVLLDGAFLVDSRIAVPEIVYLTLAAFSYLLLFRFIQASNPYDGRRTLLLLGVALGLCLGGKLLLPGVAFLLVIAFLIYTLATRWPVLDRGRSHQRTRFIVGATLLVGATAALGYLGVFMPNYLLLGWRGVEGLVAYFRDAVWLQQNVTGMGDLRASPWWSWPLMAHPFVYWREPADQLETIWFGGNPVLWWGALVALCVTGAHLVSRPNLAGAFVVIGYFGYLLIIVPIERVMYLYHYMPALFLGFLALANVVSDCWRGQARPWEQALLLAAITPAIALAIGGTSGLCAIVALAIAAGAILWRSRNSGRLVCVAFLAATLAAFVYFLPIWTGSPVSRADFDARMWMHGPGLYDWTQETR